MPYSELLTSDAEFAKRWEILNDLLSTQEDDPRAYAEFLDDRWAKIPMAIRLQHDAVHHSPTQRAVFWRDYIIETYLQEQLQQSQENPWE